MRIKKSFASTQRRRQMQRHHTKMLNRRHLQFTQSLTIESVTNESRASDC
ncbi:hypothetical protein [Thalassotalea sp. PLHSN55]